MVLVSVDACVQCYASVRPAIRWSLYLLMHARNGVCAAGMMSHSDVCLSSVHLVFRNWGRRLGFPHLHVLHGYHDFGRVGPWRRPGSLFPPEARQHGTGVVPARKRVRAVHGAVDALHHDRREHKKTYEAEYVELHGGDTTDLPRQPTDAALQPDDGAVSNLHRRPPTV